MRMRRGYTSWLLIFFLIFSLFSGLLVSFDPDNMVVSASDSANTGFEDGTINQNYGNSWLTIEHNNPSVSGVDNDNVYSGLKSIKHKDATFTQFWNYTYSDNVMTSWSVYTYYEEIPAVNNREANLLFYDVDNTLLIRIECSSGGAFVYYDHNGNPQSIGTRGTNSWNILSFTYISNETVEYNYNASTVTGTPRTIVDVPRVVRLNNVIAPDNTDADRHYDFDNHTIIVDDVFSSEYGTMTVNVYNESSPTVAVPNWDIVVYDGLNNVKYSSTGNNNPTVINCSNFGLGTVYFQINATGYTSRTYYTTIVKGTNYLLDAFLPPDTANTYSLIVVDDTDFYHPSYIGDAEITITRYINGSMHEISSGVTDYSGRYYVSLISGATYFVNISALGYSDSTHTYVPSSTVFEYTFHLSPSTPTSKSYDDFWENVSIDISMVSAGCLQGGNITITYLDSNSSTTNTEMQLWEIYGVTNTLLNTWTNTSSSFFNINGSINTSRTHYMVLFFNNTADFGIVQPIVIRIPAVDSPMCGSITPFDLDDRIDDVIGPFSIGDQEVPWTVVIGTIIPIIILVSFGPFNTGLGIIGCGISMAMLQGFLNNIVSGGFQWEIVGIGIFIIVIGILYIMTKGTGGDRL